MREFLRNTKKVRAAVARGEVFDVLDHRTPVFRIVPIDGQLGKRYAFDDVRTFRFESQDTKLSKNIDAYLYGKA